VQQSESSELHPVPNCTELDSSVNMSGLMVLCLITSTTPTSFHSTLAGHQPSQTEPVFTLLFVHDTQNPPKDLLFLHSFMFVSKKSIQSFFAKALYFLIKRSLDQTLENINGRLT